MRWLWLILLLLTVPAYAWEGFGEYDPHVIADWSFAKGGKRNTLYDKSPYLNHGTLVGFTHTSANGFLTNGRYKYLTFAGAQRITGSLIASVNVSPRDSLQPKWNVLVLGYISDTTAARVFIKTFPTGQGAANGNRAQYISYVQASRTFLADTYEPSFVTIKAVSTSAAGGLMNPKSFGYYVFQRKGPSIWLYYGAKQLIGASTSLAGINITPVDSFVIGDRRPYIVSTPIIGKIVRLKISYGAVSTRAEMLQERRALLDGARKCGFGYTWKGFE